MKRFLTLMAFFFVPISPVAASPDSLDKTKGRWWDSAIFYEIWPRSFQDFDGDGNGDFKGITSKLDYLQDLGITAIWLTPMFEAPSYHGYDFQEFYAVESDYGSMEDLDELLAETEKRGIKVIADLVLNHISTESDWFKKSAQKIAPFTDYFVWRKERPSNGWGKPWASPEYPEQGYGKADWVWIYNKERGEYYYAAFAGSQPDLNLLNPAVVTELKKIAKFWIDKGFDGFRLDAIRYAIEDGPHPDQADTESTLDFWVDFNRYVKSIRSDILLVGEVWASIETTSRYYRNGKGVDLCFDFNFGNQVINALNSSSNPEGSSDRASVASKKRPLSEVVRENYESKTSGSAPVSFFSPFLTNHDQDRIMFGLGNDMVKMKMAAVLLMTHVGAPCIYYGEEIGMSQFLAGSDEHKRAIMQWNDGPGAGFTSGNKVWLDDPRWFPFQKTHQPWWKQMWKSVENKAATSVEGQSGEANSLLNLYKTLIRIRKQNPEFLNVSNESMQFIDTKADLLAYKRIGKDGAASIVLINGSSQSPTRATLGQLTGKPMMDLLTERPRVFPDGNILLQPGGYEILKERASPAR